MVMEVQQHSSKKPAEVVQILLVDDHPIVRERVAEVINREPDLKVCGEAADRHEALRLIGDLKPGLVIVDLNLKNSHGLELIKDVHLQFKGLRMLVLSMYDVPMYAERALRAGALGYITKREATRNILVAIRRVLQGHVYLNDKLAEELTHKMLLPRILKRVPLLESLSDRELQVLEQLGRGRTAREMAGELHLDLSTINSYRTRLREKLNLSDGEELVRFASKWIASNQIR